MEYERTVEFLECILTPEELTKASKQQARKCLEKKNLENEKKATVSQYAAKINACDAELETLAHAVDTGREFRNVECEIHYNEPEPGYKTYFRIDTKEEVKVSNMTKDEMNDMFKNGWGNRDGEFVFNDRQSCPIIENDTDFEKVGWESVKTPMSENLMVGFFLEKEKYEYRVLSGEFDDDNLCYQLQRRIILRKIDAPADEEKEELMEAAQEESPEQVDFLADEQEDLKLDSVPDQKEEPPAPPAKVGDIGNEFVFPCGSKVRIFDFEKLPEAGKFFLQENDTLNKKAPASEVLKMQMVGSPLDYTVIRGGDKQDNNKPKYCLCRKKSTPAVDNKPAPPEVCGHRHADGIRVCAKEKGHDGNHRYATSEE